MNYCGSLGRTKLAVLKLPLTASSNIDPPQEAGVGRARVRTQMEGVPPVHYHSFIMGT